MVSDYRESIGSHMRTFTCFYIVWDSFRTDIGNHNNYCITTSLEPSAELHYSEVLLYVRTYCLAVVILIPVHSKSSCCT